TADGLVQGNAADADGQRGHLGEKAEAIREGVVNGTALAGAANTATGPRAARAASTTLGNIKKETTVADGGRRKGVPERAALSGAAKAAGAAGIPGTSSATLGQVANEQGVADSRTGTQIDI